MTRLAPFAFAAIFATTAWAAFERPSENERLRALGNRFEEAEPLRSLLEPGGEFFLIPIPGPHDWLTEHEEKGQSFDEYRNSEPNPPDATRRIIYLQPIGDFPEETSPPLADVRAYAAAFFQMEVKVLPVYEPNDLEFDARKNPRFGQRQLLTMSIMNFLKPRLPADAYCLLGVTMADLYPAPSWNYVFGSATLSERVGAYSFVRYDPEFWGDKRGKDYRDVILRRSCKVLVHEIGHMFGRRSASTMTA